MSEKEVTLWVIPWLKRERTWSGTEVIAVGMAGWGQAKETAQDREPFGAPQTWGVNLKVSPSFLV